MFGLRAGFCQTQTEVSVLWLLKEHIFSLRFTQTHRDECFRFVVVYMFAVLFQSTLFLMMAIDLLLAVTMPIRYSWLVDVFRMFI